MLPVFLQGVNPLYLKLAYPYIFTAKVLCFVFAVLVNRSQRFNSCTDQACLVQVTWLMLTSAGILRADASLLTSGIFYPCSVHCTFSVSFHVVHVPGRRIELQLCISGGE